MNRRAVAALAAAVVLLGVPAVHATVGLPGAGSVGGDATTDPGEGTDPGTEPDAGTATDTDSPTPTPTATAEPDVPRLIDEGDALVLDAAEGQVVRGVTDLEPGTELTVRLKNTGSSPFLLSNATTVASDGTFEATFDLSKLRENATFEVVVRHEDDVILDETGEVVVPPGAGDGSDDETAHDVRFDGDTPRQFEAAEGRVVSGEADLDPGTELVVRVRSTGGPSPFLLSNETVVAEDGTFDASFDLSDAEPGTDVRVTAHHDGDVVGETSGEVVADDE